MKKIIGLVLSMSLLATGAMAQDKAAVIYGKAGKRDMMVNQNVFMMGVKPYIESTKRPVFELEPQFRSVAQEAALQLIKDNYSPIIFVGSEYVDTLNELAVQFPQQKFVIIDAMVDQPNVRSAVFAEHEGSFIVGAVASMVSKNHKVGFIGGMESPMVRKYACGYAQGAKYVDELVEVDIQMASDRKSGFKKPELGERLAEDQINRGVDIIYQVAGHTHIGIFNAIERHDDVYAIGSTNNQNWMRPGHVLTSMVKHAGMVTRSILNDIHEGNWEPGIHTYGLAHGGIGWATDEYNTPLLPPGVIENVNQIKQDIIDGKISVHNYVADQSCPA